jgi:hypothetical protein
MRDKEQLRVPIASVLGARGVPVENELASCPFHEDRTPSFHVTRPGGGVAFEDAVTRHRMLNAIETAAATGQRQTLA